MSDAIPSDIDRDTFGDLLADGLFPESDPEIARRLRESPELTTSRITGELYLTDDARRLVAEASPYVDASDADHTADLPDGQALLELAENATGEGFEAATTDAALDELRDMDIRAAGGALDRNDLAAYLDAGLDSERTFTSRQGDRVSVTLYELGSDGTPTSPTGGIPTLEFQGGDGTEPVADFFEAVRTAGPSNIDPGEISRNEELIGRAEDRDTRRATREAARDAATAAGVDLDAYDIGATAGGEVILQDADTGRSRRIDPADASGGLASAIDAETSGGGFVADDADPAASGSDADDGLGARAAGAIVLLFGAIAAALGWLP